MKRKFILAWVFCILNIPGLYAQQAVNLDSVTLAAMDVTAGSTTLYTLSFRTSDSLSAGATLVLDFPAEFDLSGILLAGSNTINGGISTQVAGTSLSLTRKGGGAVLSGNQTYSLMFGNVKNPAPGNYNVRISLWQGPAGNPGNRAATTVMSIFAPGS